MLASFLLSFASFLVDLCGSVGFLALLGFSCRGVPGIYVMRVAHCMGGDWVMLDHDLSATSELGIFDQHPIRQAGSSTCVPGFAYTFPSTSVKFSDHGSRDGKFCRFWQPFQSDLRLTNSCILGSSFRPPKLDQMCQQLLCDI